VVVVVVAVGAVVVVVVAEGLVVVVEPRRFQTFIGEIRKRMGDTQ